MMDKIINDAKISASVYRLNSMANSGVWRGTSVENTTPHNPTEQGSEPMISREELAKIERELFAQKFRIADAWIHAVRATSYLPQPEKTLQIFFEDLVERCISALFEPKSSDREHYAASVGEQMAKLRYLHPEALGETQKVLGNLLLGAMPPDLAGALTPRIFDLLSGFSVGYMRESRHEMLISQERLHKSVRETLLASEEKFRRLTEIVSAAIFIFQGIRLRYVNNWVVEKTGYTRDEIFRMNVWDVFHPAHRRQVAAQADTRLIRDPVSEMVEVRLQRKDGRPMWVEVSFASIEFEAENAVLCTAFDITERKRAAERRVALLKKVQKADLRQRTLLKAIPDLVFRLDTDGRFIDYHTNFEEMLFLPAEQFLQKTAAEVLPAPVGPMLHETALDVAQTGETQEVEYQLDINGTPNFFEAHFVSGGDEVLVTIRDVTRRKTVENRMIHTERMAALGNLAATLAHEINNPLQAIQFNLDMILDYPISEAEKEENSLAIRHDLMRMTELSQQILNFANPRPSVRMLVQPVDVVNQVLRLWRKKLESSNVLIVTDISDTPPIRISKNQIHQVLLNILLNAVDAIQSSSDHGTIVVSIGHNQLEHTIWIKLGNDGPNVPAEDLDRLFDPFFSTKQNGNGLGLWSSYNIIQQHAGTLTVENFPGGQGVIFTLTLPVATVDEDEGEE